MRADEPERLKPCPICGSDDVEYSDAGDNWTNGRRIVRCNRCGLTFPCIDEWFGRTIWNTRADSRRVDFPAAIGWDGMSDDEKREWLQACYEQAPRALTAEQVHKAYWNHHADSKWVPDWEDREWAEKCAFYEPDWQAIADELNGVMGA